jgi:hypothetical protein
MAMIKVGDRVINTDAIAFVNLLGKRPKGNGEIEEGVKIAMLSNARQDYGSERSVTVAETLFFVGDEAMALRWYFEHHGKDSDVMELYYSLGEISWIR